LKSYYSSEIKAVNAKRTDKEEVLDKLSEMDIRKRAFINIEDDENLEGLLKVSRMLT
jgi:hypothetical protein